MLVSDLKEVAKVESKIVNLQNELVALYKKRAAYLGTNSTATPHVSTTPVVPNKPIDLLYRELKSMWQAYGVTIPSLASFRLRLKQALKLQAELETAQPQLRGAFKVILVPPTDLLKHQQLHDLRNKQPFIRQYDFIDTSLVVGLPKNKTWRVLLAYAETEGLDMGSAADILRHKKYKMAGHDMRSMGMAEYIALTLHMSEPIDVFGWSLLLKGTTLKKPIVSAIYMYGQYRFEVDDASGLLAEDTFRPAIEIKAGK